MLTLESLKNDKEIATLFLAKERQLQQRGYTEHGVRHVSLVADRAKQILQAIGCCQREVELGCIAGFLHDIGNAVNRANHPYSGAVLAYNILTKKGMPYSEATEIMMAIGNHDETDGVAVSKISAAIIIADKSDVHRSRVRQNKILSSQSLVENSDIHDRVNFAVTDNSFEIESDKRHICLRLGVNTQICSPMDYFDIFLGRMRMCINSAQFLGYAFKLEINGHQLL